ncbi:MAG: hypothetical protein A2836_03120 [Candidatus Taylorbacteria bacterium RIFCSPHIGHO2_01_FULL_45_63]|uniref:Zinc finger DksA/TraR C4-type domain-containing protein n=1 Tax=Candidatus Taylorbacteria bacterium RIFCSPHIGHO2_02_FULL_45_35 TaxID=1802311 RepID=A0A1G2MUE7_9BACT|nr:MAG: hypothetical protein A2836_03120 [Candidatus Taylorbacteria bacterium RIFCSPHIGHO2_01_FULL_45_63]OHA26879.1 MAG: hypothetical protein A3D56_04240 [Candidatus Taylorbacteria bacterium RIFCSPHIGHO2_02_FULL_45_35]
MTLDTKKLKAALEEEQAKLEKELQTVGRINPRNPKDWEPVQGEIDALPSDSNEVADTIEEYEENTAILKELEIRFNEVKEALKKIEVGTYGTCEVCGAKIEDDRLTANPAAKTCKVHMK